MNGENLLEGQIGALFGNQLKIAVECVFHGETLPPAP